VAEETHKTRTPDSEGLNLEMYTGLNCTIAKSVGCSGCWAWTCA